MGQDSVSYTFGSGIFHLRARGHYTPADLRREFLRALDDPELPEKPRFLLDVTESESLAGRSADEVRAMAEFLVAYFHRIHARFAIAAEQDAHFGLMRMAQVYAEHGGIVMKVFRSVEEARAWLLNPSEDSPPGSP